MKIVDINGEVSFEGYKKGKRVVQLLHATIELEFEKEEKIPFHEGEIVSLNLKGAKLETN